MIKTVRKIIAILTISVLLLSQTISISAFEAPTPPPEPTAPTLEETQSSPPPAPEAPTAPSSSDTIDPAPTAAPEPAETEETNQEEKQQTESIQPQDSQTGQVDSNGNVGDTTIQTGDGLTTGFLTNEVNNNAATQEQDPSPLSDSSAENTNNGSDSTNSASSETTSSTTLIQDNVATVGNNMELTTTTGESSASQNVGNSTITTGDANVSGTLLTMANSNVAGLAVSEFNIVDDIEGDYILDFAEGCILGCDVFDSAYVTNTGNGEDSTNDAAVSQNIDNQTFQNNEAILENNLDFTANSGDNQTDQNTGGDSTITTGDANISASVVNFLNSNLAGNILLGVVNIFGDLIGDIILPEEILNAPLTSATNTANGSDSTNTALVDNTIDNTTFQTNDALIQNNLDFTANTGDNQTNKNTGGNSSIETGEANIESQTLNIVNSNIDGGNWWLVLVNKAGEWVGKILGTEDGSNIAGSQGTEFSVDPNGDITVTNQGNGTESTNTTSATSSSTTTTVQDNIARIINNINLFANTGGNSASQNTGGDSTITTGDANIVASLVNFINNNIVGNGRLTITIVNVFGSWIGDFVTPGNEKEKDQIVESLQNTDSPPNSTDNTNQEYSPVPVITQNTNLSSENSSSSVEGKQNSSANLLPSPTLVPLSQNSYQGTAQVAGLKITANNPATPSNSTQDNQLKNIKKKININLAWLLTLAPFAGISFLIKKRLK
ncbi:hypothetical protein HY383_02315 [Candidatus Daviesbacteria bacterium]|nr:hypothetical protein [Candidatus Daviesbacteria bacterium]